jgi:hypothetical protein
MERAPVAQAARRLNPASSGKRLRLLRDARRCVSQTEAYAQRLGGFTARERPAFGLRPTLRFTAAGMLTLAWVAFAVWFSGPWRDELEDAIGPITAWVIPTLLAYIPGLVIGFLCSPAGTCGWLAFLIG